MSISAQPSPVAVKKRSTYRRLLLLTALLLFGSIAGWMIWGAIRDWADAKALQDYFTELEAREPGWQDRVYGKPLTQAQLDDHQKWNELQQAFPTNNDAWRSYWQGLTQGMYHNPAQPAAMWPPEQVEFIKTAHQFWHPVLKKLSLIEKLPGHYRYVERNAPSEEMFSQFAGQFGSTVNVVNSCDELEVMYYIMMNDPEQAFKWFTRCNRPTFAYLFSMPFHYERWLNMTQPQAKTLLQMQLLIEQNARWPETNGFADLGARLRLMEKLIHEVAHGEQNNVQIDRLGDHLMLINRDSTWKTPLLDWLRPYYLKYRISNMFQRPSNLILRLHQLADHVEELATLDLGVRWTSWKNFAEAHSILIDRDLLYKQTSLDSYSAVMPEGLFRLGAIRYVHLQVLVLFELQAQLNTAGAAVAAERFRLDHGRFPKDWAELVPAYVDKPILDPFTGKPLLFKLNEKGIVIYSVGKNGQDEGGEKLIHNYYWVYDGKGLDSKNANLGTRVYLPALRRGPATQLEEVYRDALKESKREMLRLMNEKKEK